jgi:signal transduction histidine kinase
MTDTKPPPSAKHLPAAVRPVDATGPERALQLATPAAIPAHVAATVIDILTGGPTLTQAFTLAVEALAQTPGVDRVAAVSTSVQPDREDAWIRLGERAWLMERAPAGAAPTGTVGKDAGAGQAVSLPWFSQQVRKWGVVGITDARLLNGPAAEDRAELEASNAAAVLGSSMICDAAMYGSLAVGRAEPGRWPDESVAAIRVLSAALASLMSAARDRAALVDAIARGDQARESQQHFFAALGHELRTPISAIIGTAELLGEEAEEMAAVSVRSPEDPGTTTSFATGVVKDTAVVLSAAEQLLGVVDALLQTGQELGGRVGDHAVNVADAVGDVVHWLKAPALAAGVSVTFLPDTVAWASTTPSGLRQILANLIGNAIAYNRPGGRVTVATSFSADEQDSPRVRITVQDTGPGLTREQQSEVFKPFVRFAGPGVPGTGLGLALSRSLAERDGGLMGVESVPGRGAAFCVDLPAGRPPTA